VDGLDLPGTKAVLIATFDGVWTGGNFTAALVLDENAMGVAFAVYCAGCCGPLLIPLYLFAAASGSLVLGTVASTGFALAMAVPIATLGLVGRRWTLLLRGVIDNYDVISRTAAMALLTLGLLLVLNRPLITVIDALHGLLGEEPNSLSQRSRHVIWTALAARARRGALVGLAVEPIGNLARRKGVVEAS